MVTPNKRKPRRARDIQSIDHFYEEAKNINPRFVLDSLCYIRPQRVMNRPPDVKITVYEMSWLGEVYYRNFILDLHNSPHSPFRIGYVCDSFDIYNCTRIIHGWIDENDPISKSEFFSSIVYIADRYKDVLHIDVELLKGGFYETVD